MVAKNATVIGHFVKRRIQNKGHDDATLVFVLEVILWRVLTDWSMSRKSNSYGKDTEDLWYGKWLKKQYIRPGQESVGSVEWEENWTKSCHTKWSQEAGAIKKDEGSWTLGRTLSYTELFVQGWRSEKVAILETFNRNMKVICHGEYQSC